MQKSTAATNRCADTSEGKTKRLTIDVSETLHKALKIKAVTDGVTMAEIVRDLLMQQIGHEFEMHINYMASVSREGTLQALLSESNLHFAALKDRDAFIARQDKPWRSTAAAQSMDTPFSKTLQDRLAWFFRTQYGVPRPPEVT